MMISSKGSEACVVLFGLPGTFPLHRCVQLVSQMVPGYDDEARPELLD